MNLRDYAVGISVRDAAESPGYRSGYQRDERIHLMRCNGNRQLFPLTPAVGGLCAMKNSVTINRRNILKNLTDESSASQ